MSESDPSNGNDQVDGGRDLLDRQIIDRSGMKAGKVDDLELAMEEDGTPPFVSAILSGPGTLAPRLHRSLGAWTASVRQRLAPSAPPSRVDFAHVSKVGAVVELDLTRGELQAMRSEDWARERFIGKIPGST